MMATPSSIRQSIQRWSLDDLSTELLVLFLKQLKYIDSRSLSAVRLVSKRLNAIATPLKYHTLQITHNIISPQAEVYFPGGIAHIRSHTRHVKVDSNLNAEYVKCLLQKIEKLSSVSWRYVQDELYKGDLWVPTDILPWQIIQSNKLNLYVENLPLRDFRSEKNNPYLKAIPTRILVSLKMATPTPPLTARVESLKGLLLNSPQLEMFWYHDRGQGTRFQLSGNERLPPFKELSLRSYDWNHSPTDVRQHWDFSKIQSLEMVDVPLSPFLNSVDFADFDNLQTLHLDDFSMHLPERRRETTRKQYALIKKIRALINLRMTCDTGSFPIAGILKHAQSLQSLGFRDYTGFTDENRRCPTIAIEDLNIMSRKLIRLHTLELDMDENCCEPDQFLHTLCNFSQLRTLTIHTQTVLDPLKDIKTNVDLDYERAMQIISLLQSRRRASWRSITINVGGWKPIMVRRLSSPWKKLHSRGLYAERCFVLERQENGVLAVCEKFPIRTS
ncbi:F-box domain-containing protein [Xylaria venustula]|nr:F-box domain-containing protein [Xylaria venustula]